MTEEPHGSEPFAVERTESKEEIPANRILHLQKEAETVQRDVQNSLLSIKKNLNLDGDDIFTEMLANRKSTSLIDKPIVQPQAESSKFKRDASKGRRLVEEPEKERSTKPELPPAAQQRVLHVDNAQSILLEDELPVSKPPSKYLKAQVSKPLPTVGELNKASELDNLINELNDIIPKSKKVVIPELPSGQVIKFNVLLTWGDPYYVGLAGLELFDENGHPIQISPKQISSKHSTSGSNSQGVDKLVNGVYLTTDSHNQWLSPFKKDSAVTVDLGRRHTISMIRLWNYNESRIHSTRGVRYLSIEVDSSTVFEGEVRKASG